jgi:hypothetical protein
MKLGAKWALACGLVLAGGMAGAQGIKVLVDGDVVAFSGIGPQMRNGRVLVPVRGVFEHMGAKVGWHPQSRMVTAISSDAKVTLYINSRTAYVNGKEQTLDVPAQLIMGRTVVPLRFLSESLGATVDWDGEQRAVLIDTAASNTVRTNERMTVSGGGRFFTVPEGTVLPVRLDQVISSNGSRAGDRFTATLRQDDMENYGGLPWGTKVEGQIVAARARRGSDPGILELKFNRLTTPSGGNYAIDGALVSLDSDTVDRRSDGTLVIKPNKKEDRLVYAGLGAAGGLILGMLTKKPLEGTLLGGILGYLYGENKAKNDNRVDNVVLKEGTEFGVRLDSDVRVREN